MDFDSVDKSSDSDGTQKQDNVSIKPSRLYVTRYDLNIQVPTNEEYPVVALQESLQAMVRVLKEGDAELVIYPWSASNESTARTKSPDDVPSRMAEIRQFFDRAFAKEAGGIRYVSARIGHNDNFKTI